MATNVNLTPELENFARSCVSKGRYNNVSEVVRSGLRLLQDQEDQRQAFNSMIKSSIKETEEKGARSMDDVLEKMDAIIEEAHH
ncbi:MAG: type II toxin-antitoxin system ParD family antitoxin [Rhodospirillaceae bacterium]|nr:MAG: type II toxin-antitoxin system ParD family antitoxin [Rhodospirillaceae bacterium]